MPPIFECGGIFEIQTLPAIRLPRRGIDKRADDAGVPWGGGQRGDLGCRRLSRVWAPAALVALGNRQAHSTMYLDCRSQASRLTMNRGGVRKGFAGQSLCGDQLEMGGLWLLLVGGSIAAPKWLCDTFLGRRPWCGRCSRLLCLWTCLGVSSTVPGSQ